MHLGRLATALDSTHQVPVTATPQTRRACRQAKPPQKQKMPWAETHQVGADQDQATQRVLQASVLG